MKSKCTLIFKALTCMVLVFLLVFGTVATSIAAVVDDLAETGWDSCGVCFNGNYVTFSGSGQVINFSSYGYKTGDTLYFFFAANGTNFYAHANNHGVVGTGDYTCKRDGWDEGSYKYNFSYTFGTSGTCLKFYWWDSGQYIGIKVETADQTAPYNNGDYYIYNNVTESWYDGTAAPKMLEGEEDGDVIRYYDFYGKKSNFATSDNGWSSYEFRYKIYSAGNEKTFAPVTSGSEVGTSYYSTLSLKAKDTGDYFKSTLGSAMSSSTAYYKLRIIFNVTDGAVKYELSTVPDMNPTFNSTGYTKNTPIDLTDEDGGNLHVAAGSNVGTVTYSDYQYSTDGGSTWNNIADAENWTPNSVSINRLRVTATDTGIDTTSGSATRNAKVARDSQTYVTTITVSAVSHTVTVGKMLTTDNTTDYTTANAAFIPAPTGGGSYAEGDTVTLSATEHATDGSNNHYSFVGWYTANSAQSSAAIGTTPVTSNTFTLGNSNVYYYALYKKVYYLTFYNSYVEEEDHTFTFVTAPPKTVTVGTRTYSYAGGTLAQRGEDDQFANSGTATEKHIVKDDGATFYEGNILLAFPGETVEADYESLASSDIIRSAMFNNSKRYTTQLETDNLYINREYMGSNQGAYGDDSWDRDYRDPHMLFADPDYYTTEKLSDDTTLVTTQLALNDPNIATADQGAHTLTWTATQDYLNIDLELSGKKEIIFSDTDNAAIHEVNPDNYYAVNENISTGDTAAERLAVYSAGNTKQINTITKNDVHCYYYDSVNGNWLDDTGAVSANPVAVTTITVNITSGSSIENSGGDNSTQYIYFTGTMPKTDVYVDLNLKVSYEIYLGSKIITDTIVHKTYVAQVATVTATPTTAGQAAITAPDDASYYATPDNVASGDSVALALTWGTDSGSGSTWDNFYMFLGWYSGDEDGPDLVNGLLNTKKDFTYKPTFSTYIYAVATRDLFINGSKYITGADTDWNGNNNFRMSYDPTKGTKGKYYWTITDEIFASASKDYSTPSDTYFQGNDGKKYWVANDANHGNAFFQILDTSTGNGDGNKSVWSQIDGFFTAGDHITYGKILPRDYNDATSRKRMGVGIIDFDEDTYPGYSSPITIYLYPNAQENGYILEVEPSYVYPNIYVSNGYEGIDTASDTSDSTSSSIGTGANETKVYPVYNGSVVESTDANYFTIERNGYGWEPAANREGHIYHYKVQKKGATIRVQRPVSGSGFKISSFFVYDAYADTVKSYSASKKDGENVYYTDIKMATGHDLYICPIIERTDADMKVVVDVSDLDTSQWGDFISCYAWYDDNTKAYGDYPGQLMVRSDDGKTYSATFLSHKPGDTSKKLAGMNFANYLDSTNTWLGGDTVMSSIVVNTSHPYYNEIGTGEYHKTNWKVQTYDYREPVAFNENKNGATSILMNFALKSGDSSKVLTTRHSEFLGATIPGTFDHTHSNGTTIESYTIGKEKFNYLKDASGNNYTDLNGNPISGKPTASYYVIAKGMVDYTNSSMTKVYYSGDDYDTPSPSVTYPINGLNYANAVEWYIYDAAGNYITNMLSSGYADQTTFNGKTYSLIGKELVQDGYAVDGRAVMICYDIPRLCYNSSGGDDAYRFTGQWLKQSQYAQAYVTGKVGMFTDNGPVIANSASEATYGGVTASIDNTKLNHAMNGLEQLYGTDTDSDGFTRAYTAIADGDSQAMSLIANNTNNNFVGWYFYNADKELELVSENVTYKPSYTGDVVYYAMYEARASYKYQYTGREGAKMYSVDGGRLDDSEMTTNKVSKARTDFGDAAKMPGANAVSIFKKTISWNSTVDPSTMLDNSDDYVMKISNATITDEIFTLTYYYPNAVGGESTRTGSTSGAFNTVIDLASLRVRQYADTGKVFVGWYEADNEGNATNKLLSTQENFGNVLVKNTKIIAVYGNSPYSQSDSWQVYIDDRAVTREMYSLDSGMYYNDIIIRVRKDSDNEVVLPTNAKVGMLVVDDGGDSGNSINEITDENLTRYARALGNGRTGRLSSGITVTNVFTSTVTKFGRTDLAIRADYASHEGHNYAIYAYIYDGSGYTFIDAVTGNYAIYSAN